MQELMYEEAVVDEEQIFKHVQVGVFKYDRQIIPAMKLRNSWYILHKDHLQNWSVKEMMDKGDRAYKLLGTHHILDNYEELDSVLDNYAIRTETAYMTCIKTGQQLTPATQEMVDGGYFRAAELKEWITILNNETIGDKTTKEEMASVVNFGKRLGEKVDPFTKVVEQKARFFVKGGGDTRKIDTYASTPNYHMMLTLFNWAIGQEFELLEFADIQSAFLQIEDERDTKLGVRIPAGLPTLPSDFKEVEDICKKLKINEARYKWCCEKAAMMKPGDIYILKKSHYGGKHAAHDFVAKIRKLALDNKMKNIEESIFVDTNRIAMFHHIDDLGVFRNKDSLDIISVIGKNLQMKDKKVIGRSGKFTFIGMNINYEGERMIIDNSDYISKLDIAPLMEQYKVKPGIPDQILAPTDEEIDMELQPLYRSLNGILGYMVKVQWLYSVYFYELSQYCTKPSIKNIKALLKVIDWIVKHPEEILLDGVKDPKLLLYTDASFIRTTKTVRAGYVCYLVNQGTNRTKSLTHNAVSWGSQRFNRLYDSSTSGELIALKKGLKDIWRLYYFVEKLYGYKPTVQINIDSESLRKQLQSGVVKNDPQLQCELDYTIQLKKDLNAEVEWIERKYQVADVMTKAKHAWIPDV